MILSQQERQRLTGSTFYSSSLLLLTRYWPLNIKGCGSIPFLVDQFSVSGNWPKRFQNKSQRLTGFILRFTFVNNRQWTVAIVTKRRQHRLPDGPVSQQDPRDCWRGQDLSPREQTGSAGRDETLLTNKNGSWSRSGGKLVHRPQTLSKNGSKSSTCYLTANKDQRSEEIQKSGLQVHDSRVGTGCFDF